MAQLGCAHPFRISRILLLADWLFEERLGKRLTSLTYRCEPFGFYIEELKPIINKLQEKGCAKRNVERKCLEYLCEKPKLPEDVEEVLREAMNIAGRLDDIELNRRVVRDPRYKRMLREVKNG